MVQQILELPMDLDYLANTINLNYQLSDVCDFRGNGRLFERCRRYETSLAL